MLRAPDVEAWFRPSDVTGPVPEGIDLGPGWIVPPELEPWLEGDNLRCLTTSDFPAMLAGWFADPYAAKGVLASPDPEAWSEAAFGGEWPAVPGAGYYPYFMEQDAGDPGLQMPIAEAMLDAMPAPSGCAGPVRTYGDPGDLDDGAWPGTRVADVYRCGATGGFVWGVGYGIDPEDGLSSPPRLVIRYGASWSDGDGYLLAWYCAAHVLRPGFGILPFACD